MESLTLIIVFMCYVLHFSLYILFVYVLLSKDRCDAVPSTFKMRERSRLLESKVQLGRGPGEFS